MSCYVFLGPTLPAGRGGVACSMPSTCRRCARAICCGWCGRRGPGRSGSSTATSARCRPAGTRRSCSRSRRACTCSAPPAWARLRAAELDGFGMVGVGRVYEAYRSGTFEPYRSRAVRGRRRGRRSCMARPRPATSPLSEAMVNIRATLARAADVRRHRRRSPATRWRRRARPALLPDRSYAAAPGRGRRWTRTGRIGRAGALAAGRAQSIVKRADALGDAGAMRRLSGRRPATVRRRLPAGGERRVARRSGRGGPRRPSGEPTWPSLCSTRRAWPPSAGGRPAAPRRRAAGRACTPPTGAAFDADERPSGARMLATLRAERGPARQRDLEAWCRRSSTSTGDGLRAGSPPTRRRLDALADVEAPSGARLPARPAAAGWALRSLARPRDREARRPGRAGRAACSTTGRRTELVLLARTAGRAAGARRYRRLCPIAGLRRRRRSGARALARAGLAAASPSTASPSGFRWRARRQ